MPDKTLHAYFFLIKQKQLKLTHSSATLNLCSIFSNKYERWHAIYNLKKTLVSLLTIKTTELINEM